MAGTDIINEQRKQIVERVIEDMEKGGTQWIMPWSKHFAQQNAVSGHVYRGANRIHLAFVSMIRGYDDPRWCTFNQAKSKGWKVKKGAKSVAIEHWKIFAVTSKNANDEDIINHFPKLVGCWRVFNACEIEGIPPMPELALRESDSDGVGEIADMLIASSRCPIHEASTIDQACYIPFADCIEIPHRLSFDSDESFTRTLLHEMAHSTGHASALNRNMSGRFGSEGYAMEELVAELGSMFASADLGLGGTQPDPRHHEQHVAYLQSWMKALREDHSALFAAASKADDAATFILKQAQGTAGDASAVEVAGDAETASLEAAA